MRERIEEILRKLPVLQGRESMVRSYATEIVMAAEIGRAEDRYRTALRPAGSKRVATELGDLAQIALCLWRHIDSMHPDSIAAFAPEDRELLRSLLEYVADRALDMRDGALEVGAGAPRGRPAGCAAGRVTTSVQRAYQGLTGTPATRVTRWDDGTATGPAHDLLNEIFAALEIKANADRRLKTYGPK